LVSNKEEYRKCDVLVIIIFNEIELLRIKI